MMLQTQKHSRLLSLFLFSAVISTITGTTTISPGKTLYASNTTQSWSSPNNTFSLHFLPVHPQTSPPSFIAAVVYSGGSPVVWSVGNNATVDSGGSLQFLSAGNLRLVNGSGSAVWDSGTSNIGVSSAMLHENGNFVLSNGSGSVWSSFENPTDTILPSQNFTVGKVLRSGLYSFSVVKSGNLILKWRDSVPYWDQGLNLNLNPSMSVVNLSSPVLGLQPTGILQLFDPKLTAPVVVAYSNDYAEGSDMLRILKLDSDGNLRIYSSKRGSVGWVAVDDQCEVFGYCGNNGICSYNDSNPICGCPSQNFEMVDPNDSRKGCVRKVRIEDCVGRVAMLQVDHTRFLTYPPQFMINPEIFFVGISACSGNCLAAGSCFASTSLSDGTGSCYIKTSNFISGYQNPAIPSTSYIKVCGNHLCPQQIQFGCTRHRNGFVEMLGHMATPAFVVSKNGSIGWQCCEVMCRNKCSCDAYAPLDFVNNTGCQLWSKGTRFIESSAGNSQRVYIVKHKVSKWWIWLITGVGAAVAVPVFCYLYCVLSRKYKAEMDRKRKQKKLMAEVGGNAMGNYGKAKKTTTDGKTNDEIQVFNLETLIAATNNFSLDNKLGEGGFGPVYKGELIDGQEIAIKRLSRSSGQGLLEFKNEAKIMAKLQHTNLVRLLGFCIERDERILIYEYMSNKSLDFYLFDASRKNVLDWKKRLNIIEGIAQGLVYLHRYSRVKVIHRDLKPSNVLLDEGMNPKISDFGMARIFGLKGPQENTNRVVGTYGYMSPEYAISGVVSVKTDVYSFGVLLLEIISGMKNNSLIHSNQPFNLMGHAWQLWNKGRALELIDPSLNESHNSVEVMRCIHIGLLCVQDHAADRPTIQDVVSFLSNYAIQLGQPKQPAFFVSGVEEESGLPNSRQESYSLNGVSISTVYGR